jgi:hypothetical protein
MKRIISWLKAWPSAIAEFIESDQPTEPETVNPDDIAEDSESGEDILMPDIYSEGNSDNVPVPEILDKPSLEDNESAGVNPYDTGVLQKKR